MRAAAAVLDIPIKSAVVSAEGDVDLRGTLGVTEGVPVGFKAIRLRVDVKTDAPQNQLDQLLELSDRYCVIFQTIQNSPKTTVKLNRVGQEGRRWVALHPLAARRKFMTVKSPPRDKVRRHFTGRSPG